MPLDLLLGTGIRVHIERKGRAAPDWEPIAAVFSDPTGNRVEPMTHSSQRLSANETELVLNTRVLSSEPVWKTDVELSRCSGFQPNELARFHGVPVPQTGNKTFRSRSISIAGGTLALDAIERRASRDRRSGFVGTHSVQLTWTFPTVTGYRMRLVRVVDQRGRAVPFLGRLSPYPGLSQLGASYTTSLPLAIPKEVTAIDVTCALTRSRYVRFVSALSRRK